MDMLLEKISKCLDGNEEALLQMIDDFTPLLKKYAKKVNTEDSYDELLIFFIKLLQNKDKLANLRSQKRESILLYLKNSIHNFSIDLSILYSKKIDTAPIDDFDVLLVRDANTYIEKTEIIDALSILTEYESNVIILHYFYGFKIGEIAKRYNVSQPAISQVKRIALSKLRRILTI